MFFVLRVSNLVRLFLNLVPLWVSYNFQKSNFDILKFDSQEIVYHYCSKPRYLKRDYWKLFYKTQWSEHAHIASTNEMDEQSLTIYVNDFAKFQVF